MLYMIKLTRYPIRKTIVFRMVVVFMAVGLF